MTRRFTALAAALAVAGVALCALALVGPHFDEFYRLRPVLDQPWHGMAGSLCLAAACALGLRQPGPRVATAVLMSVLAAGWAGLGWLTSEINHHPRSVLEKPSPDGLLTLMALTTHDPEFLSLVLRTHTGPLSREHTLCRIHPGILNRPHAVIWTGSRTLHIDTAWGNNGPRDIDVTVAADGTPDRSSEQCGPGQPQQARSQ